MTAGMNLINLYQNEYSFEEKVNENFKKVDSFSTLSVKQIITSSKTEIENDTLYLIGENNDDFFRDKIGQVACYNANIGWFFYQPKEGSILFLQNDKKFYFYSNSKWQVMQNGTISTENSDIDLSEYLKKSNNLSDINDLLKACDNLNVYTKDEVYNKNEIDEKIINAQISGEVDTSLFLTSNGNLSELTNKTTARTNLDVYAKAETYSKTEVDSKISNINIPEGYGATDASTCLLKSNNLSDLTDVDTARGNLDVYSKSDTYNRSKNLLDILDQDSACHNIGTLRDWEIRRVGDYKFSAMKTDHDNWLICDGRAINRADYKDLFILIGTSFGVGDGSTTFNIPDFRNKTMWGANGNLNSTLSSGLPDITGSFIPGAVKGLTYPLGVQSSDGCFSKSQQETGNFLNNPNAVTSTAIRNVQFNASASNSIYGNSTVVQPPAICVNVFILAKQ